MAPSRASVFDDRALALQYLAKAKVFRADAYVTSMATWCRNARRREGYFECQRTG